MSLGGEVWPHGHTGWAPRGTSPRRARGEAAQGTGLGRNRPRGPLGLEQPPDGDTVNPTVEAPASGVHCGRPEDDMPEVGEAHGRDRFVCDVLTAFMAKFKC